MTPPLLNPAWLADLWQRPENPYPTTLHFPEALCGPGARAIEPHYLTHLGWVDHPMGKHYRLGHGRKWHSLQGALAAERKRQ